MVNVRPSKKTDSQQAYYTSSPDITSFMAQCLAPICNSIIWEPCAGHGDLIDAVIKHFPDTAIIASESDESAALYLRNKYKHNLNIKIKHEDALDSGMSPLFDNLEPCGIIANPPYGAWQSHQRRKSLKERFPNIYVKETYATFLAHSLERVKNNGRVVFIMPDTLFWLNRHEKLRCLIFKNFTVERLAFFPSNFFPNVNFGYSGLVIASISKTLPSSNHKIQVFRNFTCVRQLGMLAESNFENIDTLSRTYPSQAKILASKHCIIPTSETAVNIKSNSVFLGDIADVVTGFYSGNNQRWLRKRSSAIPRSKGYETVNSQKIAPIDFEPTLNGIDDEQCFIPIVRGGSALINKPTNWYLDWSIEAVKEYTKKGKNPARFQNSTYYFRQGIAVPMVASKKLSASILNNRIFDQSIVGIFPKDIKITPYILMYLNSSFASQLLNEINPTANNSANYLKRLRLILPNKSQLDTSNEILRDILSASSETSEQYQKIIDEFIYAIHQDQY